MTHGSLFSGIGGFDLAAEWMGWQNVFHCEWNPFGQKVLKHYWPQSISYNDITKTDFTIHAGSIDILTGGFPCQPYSAAGKRLGKEDERHLWPEMCRAIREISPRYVVGENVRGLTNWNGGMVFDEVQADLEAAGYEVLPFLLPAAGVNAPHRRDRIWFVAHRHSDGLQETWPEQQTTGIEQYRELDGITKNAHSDGRDGIERQGESGKREQRNLSAGDNERLPANNAETGITADTPSERREERQQDIGRQNTEKDRAGLDDRFKRLSNNRNASDTESTRLQGGDLARSGKSGGAEIRGSFTGHDSSTYWQQFPTQSPVCSGDDGLPTQLDGITFPKWRNESIKAYGNAIVPQVAYQIFKTIQKMEEL